MHDSTFTCAMIRLAQVPCTCIYTVLHVGMLDAIVSLFDQFPLFQDFHSFVVMHYSSTGLYEQLLWTHSKHIIFMLIPALGLVMQICSGQIIDQRL